MKTLTRVLTIYAIVQKSTYMTTLYPLVAPQISMSGPDGVTGGRGWVRINGRKKTKSRNNCVNKIDIGEDATRVVGGARFGVGRIRGEGALEHGTPDPDIPHQGAGKGSRGSGPEWMGGPHTIYSMVNIVLNVN